MIRPAPRLTPVILAPLLLLLAGCAGRSARLDAVRASAVHPALVLHEPVPDHVTAASPAWEQARNDHLLSVGGVPEHAVRKWVEVRTLDRLITSHGRPHEHSRTTIRTIEQRGRR